MDGSGHETKDSPSRAPVPDPQAHAYTASAMRSGESSLEAQQILHDLSSEAVLETPSTQVSPGPQWAHTRTTLASGLLPPTASPSPANHFNTLTADSSSSASGLTPSTTPHNPENGILPISQPGSLPQLRFHPLSWAHLPHNQALETSRAQDVLQQLATGVIPSLAPSEAGSSSPATNAVPPSLLAAPSLAPFIFPQSLDHSSQSPHLYTSAFLPHLAALGALPGTTALLSNPGLPLLPNPSDTTPRGTSSPLAVPEDPLHPRKNIDPLRFGTPSHGLPDATLSLPALMNPYALALYYQSALPFLAAPQLALPQALRPGAAFSLGAPFLPPNMLLNPATTQNASPDQGKSVSVPHHPLHSASPSQGSIADARAPLGSRHARQSSSRLEFSSSHNRSRSATHTTLPTASAKLPPSATSHSPISAPSTPGPKTDLHSAAMSPTRSYTPSKALLEPSLNDSFVYRNKGATVSFAELLEASKNRSSSKTSDLDTKSTTMHTSSHATRISSLADEGLAWEASLCDTTGHLPTSALGKPSPEDWFHSWQLNRRVAAKWLSGVSAEILQLLFDISKYYACNFEGLFLDFTAPEVPSQAVLAEFLRLIREHIAANMESDSRLVHVATSYFNCSSRKRAAPECGAKLNTQLWFDASQLEFFESIEGAKKSNSKNLHSAACRACHKSRLPPSVSTLRIVDRLLSLGHPPAVVEEMIRNQALAKSGGFDDGRLLATTGTIFNRQRKVRTEQSKQTTSPHPSRRKSAPSAPSSHLTRTNPNPPSPTYDSSDMMIDGPSSLNKLSGRSKPRGAPLRTATGTPQSGLGTFSAPLQSTDHDQDPSALPNTDAEEEVLLTLSHLRRSPLRSPVSSPSDMTLSDTTNSSPTALSPRQGEPMPPAPNREPNPKKRSKDLKAQDASQKSAHKRVRLI